MLEKGREDWRYSSKALHTANSVLGSRSRLHLEQQGGSEKLQKSQSSKLGVWISFFCTIFREEFGGTICF